MPGSNKAVLRERRSKGVARCGHAELVKVHGKWKCVACGSTLTIEESIQNSIELSDAMKSAEASRRPIVEALDDTFGLREWENILSGIAVRPDDAKVHRAISRRGRKAK